MLFQMLCSYPKNKALLYQKQALIERHSRADNQAMIDTSKDSRRGNNLLLAKKIADAIKGSPLNSKEVADACDVTPQAVNGWKSTGRISKEMLGKLADVLKVPLSHFISGGEHQQPALSIVQTKESDIVAADEILELITAYKTAAKKDRDLIMTSAKTAAELALSGGTRATGD